MVEAGKGTYEGKRGTDLIEEKIDEVILRALGLQEVFDLDYDTYKTLLKERMMADRMGQKMDSGEADAVTQEYKRVKTKAGRFRLKTEKIKSDSFKPKTKTKSKSIAPITDVTKLLPGSAFADVEKPQQIMLPPKKEPSNVEKEPKADSKEETKKKKSSSYNFSKIESILDDIAKNLKSAFSFEKDKDKKRNQEEGRKKKKQKESTLEKTMSVVAKIGKKILEPLKGPLDYIFNWITYTFLGKVFLGLLDWISDPANTKKMESIGRFLSDHWPVLIGAYLIFGTSLGRFVSKLLFSIARFTARIVTKAIPALLRAIAKNPIRGGLLLGATAIAGKLAYDQVEKIASGMESAPEAKEPSGTETFAPGGQITSKSGTRVKGAGADTQLIAAQPGEVVMNLPTVKAVGAENLLALNSLYGGSDANKPKMARGVQTASSGGLVAPTFRGGGIVGMQGGGPSLMPGAGGPDGGINPFKHPKAWFHLGENTRIPNESTAKFGNPLDYFRNNPNPNTLFGDDALQRGMSNKTFASGGKPGIFGRPQQAFNPFRPANLGGPGSGPTPITRQIVKRLAPRLAGAARLSSPIGLGIEGGQLLGNMGIEYAKRRDKEKEAQQKSDVKAITGTNYDTSVSGMPAQLTQTKPRGFGENIQHAIQQSGNFLSGMFGMQGGGVLDTLGGLGVPGTGTVMAPRSSGPRDIRGNQQTDPGFQSKFLGIPLGSPTSGASSRFGMTAPLGPGGDVGGYTKEQKKRYSSRTGSSFVPTSYAGSISGAMGDSHLRFPGLPSLQNKKIEIPDYMMPSNTSKSQQPQSGSRSENDKLIGESFKNFGKNVQTIEGRNKKLEKDMRELGYKPDGYVNLGGNPIKKKQGGGAIGTAIHHLKKDEKLSSLEKGKNTYTSSDMLNWGAVRNNTPIYPYMTGVDGDRSTIGWGSTFYDSILNGKKPVKINDPPITKIKADNIFSTHITELAKVYSEKIPNWKVMSDSQKAGLLILGYNAPYAPIGAYPKLTAALNTGDITTATKEAFDRTGPNVARKTLEKQLLLSGPLNLRNLVGPKIVGPKIVGEGTVGNVVKTGAGNPQNLTPEEIKNNQEYAKSKGKYYSSFDNKTYQNYQDALDAQRGFTGNEGSLERGIKEFLYGQKAGGGLIGMQGGGGMFHRGAITESSGRNIKGATADRQLIAAQPGEYMLPVDAVMKMGGVHKIDQLVSKLDSNSNPAKKTKAGGQAQGGGSIAMPGNRRSIPGPPNAGRSGMMTLPPITGGGGGSGGGGGGNGGGSGTVPSFSATSSYSGERSNKAAIYGIF